MTHKRTPFASGSSSRCGEGRTRFNEQVGRLDIPMHDAELMSVFQRKGGLHAQERRRADVRVSRGRSLRGLRTVQWHVDRSVPELKPGKPHIFPAAQVLDDRGQCLPLDVLHGVVVDAALAADAEDGHDVRVVQARGGLCFVLESLQLPGIERGGKRQHLERDAATE